MQKRKLGKNHGIWCGRVYTEPEFSHNIKNKETNEVLEEFYKFYIETETEEEHNGLTDHSILPVTVSKSNLDKLGRDLNIGNIVFVKGSWRTYDYKKQERKTSRLEQTAFVKIIEIHEEFVVKTRNKIEIEGVLVGKLYEAVKDEDGSIKKDEFGSPVPVLDENKNKVFTVRPHRDGGTVNDYMVAINRPKGRIPLEFKNDVALPKKYIQSDYIPCVSYEEMAKKVAYDIDLLSEVKGVGYIRSREYIKGGQKRTALEAVITEIWNKKEKND